MEVSFVISSGIEGRYSKWIQASFAVANIENYAIISVQEIGRLDCLCIHEDSRICLHIDDEEYMLKNMERNSNHYLFSKLWVLAAYELIRVIHLHYRGIKKNSRNIPDDLYARIQTIHNDFLRLRVPLAKFQPSNKNSKTDWGYAHPSLDRKKGVIWFVSNSDAIVRRDLSDNLLKILGEMNVALKQKCQ
jgi:hypothetical protein